MTHLTKELEQDYDLSMPDSRGYGKSASGRGDYSMEADSSKHLVADYPQMARAMFLEDPPIVPAGDALFYGQAMEKIGKMMKRFMLMFKLMPKFIGVGMARKSFPT
jgi:hypothetical protein